MMPRKRCPPHYSSQLTGGRTAQLSLSKTKPRAGCDSDYTRMRIGLPACKFCYVHTLSITKNNNIHIHELSVALYTLGTKGLIHTNATSPKLNVFSASRLPKVCFPLHVHSRLLQCDVRSRCYVQHPVTWSSPQVKNLHYRSTRLNQISHPQNSPSISLGCPRGGSSET